MPITDYFSAGPLIMQRLRDRMPGVNVVPSRGAADLTATTLPTPTLAVIYAGDRLGEVSVRGASQAVFQKWQVVIVAKNATQGDGAEALMAVVGPLLAQVLDALAGYSLSTQHRPLTRVSAPLHDFLDARAFFPLAFECQVFTLAQ